MNTTAAFVFKRCDGETTVDGIVAAYGNRFGVDEETARRDVAAVLRDLAAQGALLA